MTRLLPVLALAMLACSGSEEALRFSPLGVGGGGGEAPSSPAATSGEASSAAASGGAPGSSGAGPASSAAASSASSSASSAEASSSGSGGPCDDGDPETTDGMLCGACQHVHEGPCSVDADCDDGNPATGEACGPTPQAPSVPEGKCSMWWAIEPC